jgi:hypothetical protein
MNRLNLAKQTQVIAALMVNGGPCQGKNRWFLFHKAKTSLGKLQTLRNRASLV